MMTTENVFLQRVFKLKSNSVTPGYSTTDGGAGAGDIDEMKSEAKKTKTVSGKFKLQLDELMASLRATQPHYIKCIKPNSACTPDMFDSVMVMQQLRYSGVLEVVRIRQEGFPQRLSFRQYYNEHTIFIRGIKGTAAHISFPDPDTCTDSESKAACLAILQKWIAPEAFRIGWQFMLMCHNYKQAFASAVERFFFQYATVIQRKVRTRLAVQHYHTALSHIIYIQYILRRCRLWRQFKNFMAIKAQSAIRMHIARKRYEGVLYMIILLHSCYRMKVRMRRYIVLKQKIVSKEKARLLALKYAAANT